MMDVSRQSHSPHIGDEILVARDSLAEVASGKPGALPTWRYIAAGSRGRLIGWRDRNNGDDGSRAVIDLAGGERRLVVFVREASVARR